MRSVINKEKTHKTLFINPGSIGQPRNLNSNAQFCVIDTMTQSVDFCSLKYDIERESKLYTNEIDSYYRDRLYKGIWEYVMNCVVFSQTEKGDLLWQN